MEYDQFMEHTCRDFGLESETYPGDSVVTGSKNSKKESRPLFLRQLILTNVKEK